MKRKELIKHFTSLSCYLLREGKRHSIYINPANRLTVAVPRHTEIADLLVRVLCNDLGIPKP